MPEDVETMRQWVLFALTIAAIPVTAFPLLYLIFSPWYKSQLGRAVLLKSLSIAFAINFSVVSRYWGVASNAHTLLVVWFFMVIFIGAAATYQLGVLVFTNFIRSEKESENVEQPAGKSGTDSSPPE
jgi:hypothetical protein